MEDNTWKAKALQSTEKDWQDCLYIVKAYYAEVKRGFNASTPEESFKSLKEAWDEVKLVTSQYEQYKALVLENKLMEAFTFSDKALFEIEPGEIDSLLQHTSLRSLDPHPTER